MLAYTLNSNFPDTKKPPPDLSPVEAFKECFLINGEQEE
jgi:hypothetical protein